MNLNDHEILSKAELEKKEIKNKYEIKQAEKNKLWSYLVVSGGVGISMLAMIGILSRFESGNLFTYFTVLSIQLFFSFFFIKNDKINTKIPLDFLNLFGVLSIFSVVTFIGFASFFNFKTEYFNLFNFIASLTIINIITIISTSFLITKINIVDSLYLEKYNLKELNTEKYIDIKEIADKSSEAFDFINKVKKVRNYLTNKEYKILMDYKNYFENEYSKSLKAKESYESLMN